MKSKILLILFILGLGVSIGEAAHVYQTPKAFVADAFNGKPPKAKALWLTRKIAPTIQQILHHAYIKKRVRYWPKDHRSVWVLQETGKEKLITVGIVVDQAKIQQIKVLEFRESRGDEIRHAFFTDQFIGAKLEKKSRLDRHIDGISGATLSVSAMKKLARMALYLDSVIHEK